MQNGVFDMNDLWLIICNNLEAIIVGVVIFLIGLIITRFFNLRWKLYIKNTAMFAKSSWYKFFSVQKKIGGISLIKERENQHYFFRHKSQKNWIDKKTGLFTANIIPIIVLGNNSKYVYLCFNDTNVSEVIVPKKEILNQDQITEVYSKTLTDKDSLNIVLDSINVLDREYWEINPVNYCLEIKWTDEEINIVQEVLYIFLNHRDKLK